MGSGPIGGKMLGEKGKKCSVAKRTGRGATRHRTRRKKGERVNFYNSKRNLAESKEKKEN